MTPHNIIKKIKTSVTKNEIRDIIPISMTVCIAALSDNKKKAVLVADKQLTVGGILPHTSNGDGKIFEINENVKVMYSGATTEALYIINKCIKPGGGKWVKEIAEYINKEHLGLLQDKLIAQHLAPRGIKDINSYYKNKDWNIDPVAKNNIDIALTTHYLTPEIHFLVVGKEQNGDFSIYLLQNNPRVAPILQTSNYAAIGSGHVHALFSIIHAVPEYKTSLLSGEIEKMLEEAKKKAQKDPQVGSETEIITMN